MYTCTNVCDSYVFTQDNASERICENNFSSGESTAPLLARSGALGAQGGAVPVSNACTPLLLLRLYSTLLYSVSGLGGLSCLSFGPFLLSRLLMPCMCWLPPVAARNVRNSCELTSC